jgi:prepilin-type processing-associated H-X9-DG protein
LQYTQDYDETMPNGFYSGDATDTWTDYSTGELNTNNYKWMDAVYPYVKNEQVFVCPSATKAIVGSSGTTYLPNSFKLRSGASTSGSSGTNQYGSYGLNMAYFAVSNKSVRGPAGQRLARIVKPAETVLSTDTNGNYLCGPVGTAPPVAMVLRTDLDPNILRTGESGNNTVNGYAAASVARHLDFSNVLFCDGHVKAQKLDVLNQTKTGAVSPFNNGPIHINFTIEDD